MTLGRGCAGYSIKWKGLVSIGNGGPVGISTGSGQIWVAEAGREAGEFPAFKAAAGAVGITTSPLLFGPLLEILVGMVRFELTAP